MNDSEINELKNKLNEEKIKNQKIIDENNNLKNRITEEKNKNKILINENKNLNQKISDLNKEIEKMKNKIKTLENDINQKNIEIQKYILQKNENKNIITSIKPGEKIMAVNFVSMGSNDIGHYNLVCKNTELFIRLEERLYEDFPQFKEYETYFEVETRRIKRFKSLDENNIKSNDIINIFIVDN